MDYRIEWSPEAAEDVDGIADFIGRDSAFYARAVVAKILAEAREAFPSFHCVGASCPNSAMKLSRDLCLQLSLGIPRRGRTDSPCGG